MLEAHQRTGRDPSKITHESINMFDEVALAGEPDVLIPTERLCVRI